MIPLESLPLCRMNRGELKTQEENMRKRTSSMTSQVEGPVGERVEVGRCNVQNAENTNMTEFKGRGSIVIRCEEVGT